MGELQEAIKRRSEIHSRIIDSLAHLPRESAMTIILAWFDTDSLEDVAPTLCGEGPANPNLHYIAEATVLEWDVIRQALLRIVAGMRTAFEPNSGATRSEIVSVEYAVQLLETYINRVDRTRPRPQGLAGPSPPGYVVG